MSEEIGPQIPASLFSKIQVNTSDSDTLKSVFNKQWNEDKTSQDPEGHVLSFSPMSLQCNTQIGPQIPSSIEQNDREKKSAKQEQNVDSQRKSVTQRRPIGPEIPHPKYSNFDEEEDDEIVIGPVLPKGFEENNDELILKRTIQEFEERAEKNASSIRDKSDKPLQRGEWMLVPPESKFLGETPTNMRSRQFKQRTHDPAKLNNSLWTETPADRLTRLQQEGTSQKRKYEKEKDDEPIKYSRIDIEKAETIRVYNEQHRSKSLLESHSESYNKSRRWKEDDASKRPFDREKDVLGSRRMDSRKRREFLNNAKELGS
ncbi:4623_t:CDS:2, partial [Scutellospora calospora]